MIDIQMPGVGFKVRPLIPGPMPTRGKPLSGLEVVLGRAGVFVSGCRNGGEGVILFDLAEGGFEVLGFGAVVAEGVFAVDDFGGRGGPGAGAGVEQGVAGEGVGVLVAALGVLGYDFVAHCAGFDGESGGGEGSEWASRR